MDRANEPIVAASAPASVARFQNRPSRKMTTIPGVKKPVYSWMYWNAWSKLPSSGRAVRIASRIATTAAIRPTRHQRASRSSACADLVVDVEREDRRDELILDAVDATIAAISAANTRPAMPAGSSRIIVG